MQAKKQLLGFLLALIIVPLLVSQNIDLWTQKITIENSFRDKLTFAINRVLDESQYFVNVEVELIKETDSNTKSLCLSLLNFLLNATINGLYLDILDH
jgi:hypothetical protein